MINFLRELKRQGTSLPGFHYLPKPASNSLKPYDPPKLHKFGLPFHRFRYVQFSISQNCSGKFEPQHKSAENKSSKVVLGFVWKGEDMNVIRKHNLSKYHIFICQCTINLFHMQIGLRKATQRWNSWGYS